MGKQGGKTKKTDARTPGGGEARLDTLHAVRHAQALTILCSALDILNLVLVLVRKKGYTHLFMSRKEYRLVRSVL